MITFLHGHVLDKLAELPPESVHCIITSPPYYGLRDYGIEPQVWGVGAACAHEWGDELISAANDSNRGSMVWTTGGNPAAKIKGERVLQGAFCRLCGAWRGSLGLEPSLSLYLDHMVEIFRALRRVLRSDGTCWLNIGDSYATTPPGNKPNTTALSSGLPNSIENQEMRRAAQAHKREYGFNLKPKDLMMIPARLAIRLQDDGWWVRSDIIWHKKSPMPESITDRPTTAHEHVFLLTKSAKYFYDAEAVKEGAEIDRRDGIEFERDYEKANEKLPNYRKGAAPRLSSLTPGKRNMRNVWHLGPEPFPEAHFATFVSEIPRRAILAGTSEKGCCSKCGAQWERVVESTATGSYHDHSVDLSTGMSQPSPNKLNGDDYRNKYKPHETLGWQPSCDCLDNNPIPATILDPFIGSGTTALVAKWLDRDCIGIEINASYIEMAKNRLETTLPRFVRERPEMRSLDRQLKKQRISASMKALLDEDLTSL